MSNKKTASAEPHLESNARLSYETIIATSPSGFWISDLQGKLLDVNPAYLQMSGYTRDELLCMKISDLEANESAEEVLRHAQLVSVRGSDQFESRHRRKDGTEFDVAISASYLEGNGRHIVVFVQDITRRKHAEEALKRSEEEYRHIVEYAPTGICEIDCAGPRFERVNDAMCQILGYTRDELLAMSPFDLLDEESKARFQERIRKVLSGEEVHDLVDYRVFARNGREIWAELSVKLTYTDGRASRALVVAHDVTERRRAREVEERLLALMDHNPSLLFMKDDRARYVYLNKAYEKRFVLSTDWRGKTDFDFWPQASAELFRANDSEIRENGETRQFLEDSTDLSGERHCWLCYKFPFTDSKGERYVGGIGIDATARVRAEEALRSSEGRFRAFVSATSDEVYRMSPDWSEMRHLNGREFIPDTGRPSRTWLDMYIPEDDRPHVLASISKAIQTKAMFELEHRVIRADGTLGWRYSRAVPLLDANGDIVEWIGAAKDITERKRAEEALQESEERFRVAQELSPDGFTILRPVRDVQGNVVDFTWIYENAAIARMNGTDPKAVIGQSLLELFPGHRGSQFFEAYRQVAENGQSRVLDEALYHGETIANPTWFRIAAVAMGEDIAILAQNISERKAADEALRKANAELTQRTTEVTAQRQRLFDMMETLPVMVCVLTKDYLVPFANRAFRQKFGESNGRHCYEYCYGQDHPCDFCESFVPLKTGQPHQWQFASCDGNTIIDAYDFPFTDTDGSPAILEMDIDVSASRKTEAALRTANERLKEADRRKDEFLAMLAHELRNPLAAISSANELLQQIGSADAMSRHALEASARQTAHMARLLDDLLDVARVSNGKVTLAKMDVSLRSVVESAVETSEPFIRSRSHRLYQSQPRERMRVLGDPVRLSQVVGNLLHNAAKYTEPGGEIYLTVERKDDQAVISVRDNGRGMEPELLPKIFDLFVQGSRSPDRADGGLGIGLTLVRSVIGLHGGRVEAHSEGPGRGSEFRIWLSLLPSTEESKPGQAGGGRQKAKPLRILVADDNQDSAELLSFLLQLEGHKVVVANSGTAAIAMAVDQVPEVALIDIGMPGMDGYEVAQRLRQLPELKHLALVAITGYGQSEDIQKSRDAGFHDHLVKPVEMEKLNRVLLNIGQNMR